MSPSRARQSLAQILAESPAPQDDEPAGASDPGASPVTAAADAASSVDAPADQLPATGPGLSAAPAQPRTAAAWTGYDRKEARLRPDQSEQLTQLARRLQRARPKMPGERITDNTLIRVAVDLLLQRQGQLSGHTEDELRASVADPDTSP